MGYSFDYFSKEIKQKPELLPLVLSWIKYLSSEFCQRQAKGKTEMEFASIVLLTREKNIPPELLQFLVKNIYMALRENRTDAIQKALNQTANTVTPNILQSLKALKTILYLPVQDSTGRRSIFSWFSKKPLKSDATKTFISSSGNTKAGEQTFISSGDPFSSDQTFISSPAPKAKIKASEPISLDQNFREALEHSHPLEEAKIKGRELNLMQRLTSHWHSQKVKTILSTNSPLVDIEIETLRMQTIVSLNKASSVLVWSSFPKEEDLRTCKPEIFFKLLQAISQREDIPSSAKPLLAQLKNSLTIRNKLLTDPQIIPNILQQGIRSWNHTLDRLSDLTTDKKINKKIWAYLQYVSHVKIVEESEIFRRKFLDCSNSEELDKLLSQYSPTKNIVKKYPALGFISALQKVKACYDQDPGGLIRYMNKYLGVYGEANTKEKLSKLLLTNEADASIAKEIQGCKTLVALQEKLGKLSQRIATSSYAEKLQTLIAMFLDPNQHLAFQQFCISLNGYSPSIRHKITNIVRQSMQKELNEKIVMLYQNSNSSSLSRLLDLYKILENTRYHDPMIQIYTYDAKILLEKLQNIKASNDPNLPQLAKHIISNPLVPKEFLDLIVEGKRSQSRARQI